MRSLVRPFLLPAALLLVAAVRIPNPTGFTAVQGKDRNVHLSWRPVPRASGYLLMGPGLPKTGVNVMGLEFDVTKVPPGPRRWIIGTVSVEGRTGPRKEFTAVDLVVK